MENCDEFLSDVNNTQAQLYLHKIQREIENESINNIELIELRKNRLIQRKRAWHELFEKYTEDLSSNNGITINNTNTETEKDIQINGINVDSQEYFSKCRIPMPKHPALVQYWVDTGNPPYQLINENDSETGSSLSEDESSKKTLLRENICLAVENNQDSSSSSLYSSVDTAAYILSNTNVTKKSETMAIVEGAKNSIDTSKKIDNTTKKNTNSINLTNDCININNIVDDCDNNNKLASSERVELADELIADKNNSLTIEKNSHDNFNYSTINPNANNCMKIADILPTLAHLDKILNSKNHENGTLDVISSEGNIFGGTSPQFTEQPKLSKRKKLYTQRNSPIDVILSTFNNNKRFSSVFNDLHPALSSPITIKKKLFKKRRTKLFHPRRKLRFSQLSDTVKNHEDETTINNGSGSVLKSLESKRIDGSVQRQRQRRKNTFTIPKKSGKGIIRKKHKSRCKLYNSDILEDENASGTSENEESERNEKLAELIALCSRKNLEIRLERCIEKKSQCNNSLDDNTNDQQMSRLSSGFSNKSLTDIRNSDLESLGSNQSTILLVKCTDDQEKNEMFDSESEIKLRQNISRNIRNQKRNKLGVNKINKNIKLTANKQKNISNISQSSTRICSALLMESDGSLSTVSSKISLRSLKTARAVNPLIRFSSDEESGFVKTIRKNVKKCDKKNNIDTSKSDKPLNNSTNSYENLIKDLTHESSNELKIPSIADTATNLTIVESDDSEIIDPQKLMKKNKKTKIKKQRKSSKELSIKTRSTPQQSEVKEIYQNTAKNTVARVLQYESSSDSSDNEINTKKPAKKLKLKDSDTQNTNVLVNNKITRRSKRRRKTRVHLTNETTGVSMKNNNKPSPKILSPVKQSNIIYKNISEPLEKIKLPTKLTRSCSLLINEKISDKKISTNHMKKQKKNELSVNKINGNVEITAGKQKNINNINRSSTRISSALLMESDGNLSTKSSTTMQHSSKTRAENPLIIFSSDEENDFVTTIRRNVKKYDKENNIDTTNSDKPLNSRANSEESDDKKIINPQKLTIKNKKTNIKKQRKSLKELSIKTRSALQSFGVEEIHQNNSKNTVVARVLRCESSSDSSEGKINTVAPAKKLKLKDSDTHNTNVSLINKISRRSERIRKTRVHLTNETIEMSMKNNKKPSPKILSPEKQSNISYKNISKSLETMKPPTRFTRSCPLPINEKISDVNKRKKMKIPRQSSMKLRSLSQINNLTQSTKINTTTLTSCNSDSDQLTADNVYDKKSSSSDNKIKKNVHKATHRATTVSNQLKDNSRDKYPKSKKYNHNRRINVQNNSKLRTFKTRFDDSDSEQ